MTAPHTATLPGEDEDEDLYGRDARIAAEHLRTMPASRRAMLERQWQVAAVDPRGLGEGRV